MSNAASDILKDALLIVLDDKAKSDSDKTSTVTALVDAIVSKDKSE